jgi:hypothetical protein
MRRGEHIPLHLHSIRFRRLLKKTSHYNGHAKKAAGYREEPPADPNKLVIQIRFSYTRDQRLFIRSPSCRCPTPRAFSGVRLPL